MLTLTRKKNEAIIVNGDIEIRIVDVQGDKVKIGITAPKEIDIYREEIYLQVMENNKQATDVSHEMLHQINLLARK